MDGVLVCLLATIPFNRLAPSLVTASVIAGLAFLAYLRVARYRS